MSGAYDSSVFEPLDEFLIEAGIEIAPFDAEQAQIARDAFMRYGKGRHRAALNFGDCASYALAKKRQAALLFKGGDFTMTDITPAVLASAP
jgi:ribonuclease VapC